ncbi:hypothetical protein QBC38DRAFT_482684 [Podospora fimiseda]|uniref:DNA ligase n=1 Tax=Podospora fimiseda TaxID=252190 RepID=A0AAN7BLK7_9PEZI|nr:hypothetical protein QBC38DRAFT_482684 [Podospora fimiseda]
MNRPSKPPNSDALEEDQAQYGLLSSEIDQQYPNRPRNHSRTLPFSSLYTDLFNPLLECKPGSSNTTTNPSRGPTTRKTRFGKPTSGPSYHEKRRHIIERYMSKWRSEVGNDFYPAMRLILPDKDRDRGVYGLKESGIGKILVKVIKIDKSSGDGWSLMHWKLPGGDKFKVNSAGDFAGRVLEVVGKRAMRTKPGGMTVAEVNCLLDRIAAASSEMEQIKIWEEVYRGFCAEEIMWFVRVVLKDMKVGATERTFLGLWHPDAEALFSVSSSLRRVCWELWDKEVRLKGEEAEGKVKMMQCFQPQLAQFQMTSGFEKLVKALGVTEGKPEFWIEEKLDGERMQMHMKEDESVEGGFRFKFWSRKAKDYTYLYGEGLKDEKGALTSYLGKGTFVETVRELILDGEMITWDPDVDKIMPFGTLKTAALGQQNNPFEINGPRPVFRVFDILFVNGTCLTGYPLWERHDALEKVVKGTPRRLEIHPYEKAKSADAIEPLLRKMVAEASEGLVLKNPLSVYQLNSRNNDWIKVKPEYMSEYGESLDCVVVGGYFGSGRRGGTLSSFLCGVRVSENFIRSGAAASREKCLSFFKVGGGLKAEDYAEIRHHTEGKWKDWDSSSPPTQYIELGGGEKFQYEKPDVWIRPSESIVISVKAASIAPSEQFAMGWTLRFPRFRKLRLDKSWDSGMDVDEFDALRSKVKDEEKERKAMEMENRKRKPAKRQKKELVIAGNDPDAAPAFASEPTNTLKGKLFDGLDFVVLSEAVKPKKMSKPDLERLIKENGGGIHQKVVDKTGKGMILLADKNVVRVASLRKGGDDDIDIIRPKWVFDCLEQNGGKGYKLPFEQGHLFCGSEEMQRLAGENVDEYGDSYVRDVKVDELKQILDGMEMEEEDEFDAEEFLDQLEDRGKGLMAGFMFRKCKVYFTLAGDDDVSETEVVKLGNKIRFGNGEVVEDLEDKGLTHVVVVGKDQEVVADVRYQVSLRRNPPRIVTAKWVEDCWKEETMIDEEDYAPR